MDDHTNENQAYGRVDNLQNASPSANAPLQPDYTGWEPVGQPNAANGGFEVNNGYAPQNGYDAANAGYVTQNGGYDAANAGYPVQTGYDAANGGYAQNGGYDAANAGYAPQNGGYDAANGGYAQTGGYAPTGGYYPPPIGGYPPQPGNPNQGAPATDFQPPKKSQAAGVVCLIFGILSVVCCFTVVLPFIFGLVSIICGIVAGCKGQNKGLWITGLILGILGIGIAVAIIFAALPVIQEIIRRAEIYGTLSEEDIRQILEEFGITVQSYLQ